MKLTTRTIGRTIVELTVESTNGDARIIADVTNRHGYVDEEFINDLREVADYLEEHNLKVLEINNNAKQH
jgi:hypothetical protein